MKKIFLIMFTLIVSCTNYATLDEREWTCEDMLKIDVQTMIHLNKVSVTKWYLKDITGPVKMNFLNKLYECRISKNIYGIVE